MHIESTELFSEIAAYRAKYSYSSLPEYIKDAYEKEMLLRLSWNTNHLEGNTLSLGETIDVIEYDEVRSGHTYSEYREAKSAFKANQSLLNFRTKSDIDLGYIQKANSLIMDSDGEYRTRRVYIGTLAEAAYVPPDPEEIPGLMEKYSERLNPDLRKKSVSETVEYAALLHLDFERIHPFQDGNGRTGRLFLNQFLLNQGLLPVIIDNNSRYRQAFKYYDRSGSVSLMEHCIAAGILKSFEVLDSNCEKLSAKEGTEL